MKIPNLTKNLKFHNFQLLNFPIKNAFHTLHHLTQHTRHLTNVSVWVRVEDENDSRPAIKVPPKNHSLLLANTAQVGHVLLRIKAMDADEGRNALLSHYIASGNEQECFEVDEFSGKLFVTKPLDHLALKEFTLGLQVALDFRDIQ